MPALSKGLSVTDVNSDLNTRSISTRKGRDSSPRPHSPGPGTYTEAPLHELMTPEVNVQRIMRTGTVWFAAAVVGIAIVLGLLLSSGWRPASLPTDAQALWWIASTIVVLSVGLIGWSGCPILEVDVPTASRNKSRTMQLGTMLFIVGSAGALFAILLGPAS